MNMSKNCLYCYTTLEQENPGDFHERCSLKFFGTATPPELGYSLNEMDELAKNVVELRIAVPGVQPKLSLSLVQAALDNGGGGRLTVVGALGGNYIFKPPNKEYDQMPENEHLTMRLAEEVFRLKVVPSSLIRLRSGELAYITRRIDRKENGEKIHMLDMFQVLESRDKYKGSHERIGKAIAAYSTNTLLDQSEYFLLVLFSFLTGNSDMHLKNFSMIEIEDGWGLSPAYDLLNVSMVLPEDKDDLALTISGKKRKLDWNLFSEFGAGLGLNKKQIRSIYMHLSPALLFATNWIDKSFLTNENKIAYKAKLEERYARLGIIHPDKKTN